MKRIAFIIFTAWAFNSYAQDLQSLYSYSLNWANINNAMVGTGSGYEALVMSRSQFNNVPGSPENIMALISANINNSQGVGIKMINDSRGIFNVTRFDGVYSQRFDFDIEDRSYIRFGLSFGALNSSLDLTNINNPDAVIASGDPEITSSEFNYTHFVSGAGVVFGYKDLEIGLSSPHMLRSASGFESFALGTATYTYSIPSSSFKLKPALIYQNRPGQDNLAEGFLTVTWKDALSFISGFTNDERLRFGGGLKFKDFEVAYLSENPVSNNAATNSTHEIALKITLVHKKRQDIKGVQSNIQKMLYETRALSEGNYDKDYLRKRLAEIDKELDLLLKNSSQDNSKEIQSQLSELEGQILLIIQKFEL